MTLSQYRVNAEQVESCSSIYTMQCYRTTECKEGEAEFSCQTTYMQFTVSNRLGMGSESAGQNCGKVKFTFADDFR